MIFPYNDIGKHVWQTKKRRARSSSVNIELSFRSRQVYGLRMFSGDSRRGDSFLCFWNVNEHFLTDEEYLQIKLFVCLRVSRVFFLICLNQTDLSVLTCHHRQHCRRYCLFSHVVDATTQKERNTTSFLHIRPYMIWPLGCWAGISVKYLL